MIVIEDLPESTKDARRGRKREKDRRFFGRTHALVRVVGGVVESSVDELVEDQFERRTEEFDGGLKWEKD
jgi:hypothetical protein